MIRNILILLTTSTIFTGCIRVGPNFKSPITPVQSTWTEHSSAIQIGHDLHLGPWWENFHDEKLNALIAYALKENFTLKAAAYRILAARANLGIAIGLYFPQTQQAEGSSFKVQLSENAPNTLNADLKYGDHILGFRAAWELDFWGRFYRGVQAAQGEYAATVEDYRDVQRILISDIVLAYVQQKTFQRRIATLEHNIALQYRSVQIAHVRFQEGYESELDYAQAVTLWKETVAQKDALEIGLKRATTALAILSGLTPETFNRCFQIDSLPLQVPEHAEIFYPAEILTQRPDLRRSLNLLYAQSARVGIAVSDLFPRISFTGFIGLETATDTKSTFNQGKRRLFSHDSLTFFYGPEFSWPLLNYGRLTNRVKEQYAILREGVALYRNQVLEAHKEVEDALTFFIKSIEESKNLEESFKFASRSVEISTLQYQEGLADYSRVLNSLQLQVAAEDNLAQSEGNIGLAYAFIFRSLGTF